MFFFHIDIANGANFKKYGIVNLTTPTIHQFVIFIN
jgi:hypothetical protein